MSNLGHVLIIDDELTLRQTLARILQREGFEVITAGNAAEGLALLSRQTLDLVYMDIRMPDMNGLEALKAIRAVLPELPVILFTAQPDLNSALEALRNGATDYLLKPLKPETILERTRTALAKVERERRKKEVQSQITNLQAELQELESKSPSVQNSHPIPDTFSAGERYLKRGKFTFDLHARRVSVGEKIITLPPVDFDYLLALARHSPNVVDYRTLVVEAQGYQAETREAQELAKWHVHHIRQAIEPDAQEPVYLINVRGTGYRLVVD
ncbi:MAG: response regulator transcription factor [Chloroflexi bacterium]|nr:response regulator transcription factor [Chloroflexota bacterium]